MAYAISGRAGDPLLARCEWVGNRIQQLHPSVCVRFDAKHPDEWENYVRSMERMLDLPKLDSTGPVVWTPDGQVMSSGQFATMAKDSFGVAAPSIKDPIFDAIAEEHMQTVLQQREQAAGGPRLEVQLAATAAARAHSLNPPRDLHRVVSSQAGIEFQVWSSPELRYLHGEYRKTFSKANDGIMIDTADTVMYVAESHVLFLALRPCVPQHCVLAPLRYSVSVEEEFGRGEADVTTYVQLRTYDAAPTLVDFQAVGAALARVNGVVTLQKLPGAEFEFRSPIDSHLQFLPFPLIDGLDAPLVPLLKRESLLKDRPTKLGVFAFKHSLQWIETDDATGEALSKRLSTELEAAFRAAEKRVGLSADGGYDLLMTREWLLLAPIRAPAADEMAAWNTLPPVPSVGLIGLLMLPEVEAQFPETTGAAWGKQGPSITKERILSTVYEDPLSVLGYWRK